MRSSVSSMVSRTSEGWISLRGGATKWMRCQFPARKSTTTSTSSRPKRRLSSLTCCCASALGNDAGLPLDIASPRDEAYYGDPGMHYTYSRREYKPLPWIPELLSLKARLEEA